MPLFSPRKQYNSLDEELVLPPLRPTTILQPEHFSAPLQGLSYPVALDFSHERFKLKSFSLLTQLKPAALAEINLTDNELRSIADLSRFVALKTLVAGRNALGSGDGVALQLPRLLKLDLHGNRLAEVPPLGGVPLLQVLNLSRNQIAAKWDELEHCAGLQALDASHNKLAWGDGGGGAAAGGNDEFSRAMAVLGSLRRLRVLSLRNNPAADAPGFRSWALANAPRLELLDGQPVAAERAAAERAAASGSGGSGTGAGGSSAGALAAGALAAAASVAATAAGAAPTPTPRDACRPSSPGRPRGGRLFGEPLESVLEEEGARIPAVLQECSRHVQLAAQDDDAGGDAALLVGDGAPSAVLALRNAFEQSDAHGIAALRGLADAAAAAALIRAYLYELPEPLIPADVFLQMLNAAAAHERAVNDGGREIALSTLDGLLARIAPTRALVLEHVLCFLVNAAGDAAGVGAARAEFELALARAWAPALLRAPARIKGQFAGRVSETSRACLLILLRQRGLVPAAEEVEEDEEPSPPPPPPLPPTSLPTEIIPSPCPAHCKRAS